MLERSPAPEGGTWLDESEIPVLGQSPVLGVVVGGLTGGLCVGEIAREGDLLHVSDFLTGLHTYFLNECILFRLPDGRVRCVLPSDDRIVRMRRRL